MTRRESTSPPRILFVSPTSEVTGPTTSLRLLLSRLKHHHDVEVLHPGDGTFSHELDALGITSVTVPSLVRRQIPALYHTIRKGQYDLLYANEVTRGTRNACLAATLAGIPFVCHVRNMGWGKRWTESGFLLLAQKVIAVSRACGASVERFVQGGRLHVVYNGITPADHSTEHVDREAIKEELGISPAQRVVASVGHLTPRKGQHHGLAIMERVLPEVADVHLCFLGAHDRDRAYVEELQAAVNASELCNHITFAGFRTDVQRLLRGADILLHTASRDPHPRAVLEGMAAGLPVIAFSTDGVAETVNEGVTGYLVPPGNADRAAQFLVELLRNRRRARQMGIAGRERVMQKFSAGGTAEKIGQLLGELLPNSQHTPAKRRRPSFSD